MTVATAVVVTLSKGEPYTYCGTVSYRSHDGDRPIRFLFDLNSPLPQELWQAWGG